MQTLSIKRFVVNIVIVVVVAGIFFTAYMFFVKEKNIPVADSVALENSENQTILIGTEISNTLKELKDLQLSIIASKNIFGMSMFRSLHDFSVAVPEERVKRENPFLPPLWKVELDKRIDAASK